MADLLFKDESWQIIGAAMEVHKQLGCGFLEKVYQDALAIEFTDRCVPYAKEKHITIDYKGHIIDHEYFADFVCYNKIIVELKAARAIDDKHRAQVINYLKATGMQLGLLINFGETSLKFERFINKP